MYIYINAIYINAKQNLYKTKYKVYNFCKY